MWLTDLTLILLSCSQNPQVEGIHRDRIIFNAKAACYRPFYSVNFNAGEGTFTLDAGSVHGVTKGSHFTIYEDHELFRNSSPWGMLVVHKVKTFTSMLTHSEGPSGIDLLKPGIAVLSAGSASQALAIMVSYNATTLQNPFQGAIQKMENASMISLGDESAIIRLGLENDHLVFDILDPVVNSCGLDRVYYSVKPTATVDDVACILSAGSRFFWHLRRGNYHPISDALKIEFMELEVSKEKFEATGYPMVSPIGENLLRDGTVELSIGLVPKPYGIKLTNNSDWDLFPTAFYFDHSDWSISKCTAGCLNLTKFLSALIS